MLEKVIKISNFQVELVPCLWCLTCHNFVEISRLKEGTKFVFDYEGASLNQKKSQGNKEKVTKR